MIRRAQIAGGPAEWCIICYPWNERGTEFFSDGSNRYLALKARVGWWRAYRHDDPAACEEHEPELAAQLLRMESAG